MARPRLPTAILESRGAFKKDPARGREREDEVTGGEPLGDRPQDLPVDVAVVWDELVDCAHAGVLCKSDRQSLEIAARLMAEMRSKGTKMEAGKIARLQAALGELGMSPASRSKVKGPAKAAPKNAFAGIVKKSA